MPLTQFTFATSTQGNKPGRSKIIFRSKGKYSVAGRRE